MKPGRIIHNFDGDWIMGRPFGPNDDRVKEIADDMAPAFKIEISDSIMSVKWTKLFLNACCCISAIVGKSMQETFSHIQLARLNLELLRECFAIVEDNNIVLVDMPNFEVKKFHDLTKMPLEEGVKVFADIMANADKDPFYGLILQSIQRGRLSEIEYINGEFVALARFGRVGAPLNMKLVRLVHQVEKTKQCLSIEQIQKECAFVLEKE